jgi:hypothetical protein
MFLPHAASLDVAKIAIVLKSTRGFAAELMQLVAVTRLHFQLHGWTQGFS